MRGKEENEANYVRRRWILFLFLQEWTAVGSGCLLVACLSAWAAWLPAWPTTCMCIHFPLPLAEKFAQDMEKREGKKTSEEGRRSSILGFSSSSLCCPGFVSSSPSDTDEPQQEVISLKLWFFLRLIVFLNIFFWFHAFVSDTPLAVSCFL